MILLIQFEIDVDDNSQIEINKMFIPLFSYCLMSGSVDLYIDQLFF